MTIYNHLDFQATQFKKIKLSRLLEVAVATKESINSIGCNVFSVFVIGVNETETRAQQRVVFSNPCVFFVQAVSKHVVSRNLQAMFYSGIVEEDAYRTM